MFLQQRRASDNKAKYYDDQMWNTFEHILSIYKTCRLFIKIKI